MMQNNDYYWKYFIGLSNKKKLVIFLSDRLIRSWQFCKMLDK